MITHKTKNKSALEVKLEALNQYKIDLGLERLKVVIDRLGIHNNLPQIIAVGGTNGKGSTVTAICALLTTQQRSFGAFTSPHIHHFNERININDTLATDDEILSAFELIDQAKADINLSYFEYAFLAAVLVFIEHQVDVMVLEVGLGGRLDAVNALDADAVVITTIDLDHMEWLGDDIEAIAKEKAGIMRPKQPVVYGDLNTPGSIISHAELIDANLLQFDQNYQISVHENSFDYRSDDAEFNQINLPQLEGTYQIKNFSSALTVLLKLGYEFKTHQLNQAVADWHIPGRLQTIQTSPLVLADVAHNRQSAQQLAHFLKENPVNGQTLAVFSVLADKQAETWLDGLNDEVDHWFIFQLESPRALEINALKSIMADKVSLFSQFKQAQAAYNTARSVANKDDRIVVFGSFHVLDEVFS